MKIGIISDSHDSEKNVLRAVEIFNERQVSFVFHAGDMISASTGCLFAGLKDAKFIGVFGNCDIDKPILSRVVKDFGGEICEDGYKGEVGGKRFFMTHKPDGLEAAIDSGKFDLIVYGHTHLPNNRKVGRTTIINPGVSASRVFSKSEVVVLNLEDMSAEAIRL
jgi:uncharacterized protein